MTKKEAIGWSLVFLIAPIWLLILLGRIAWSVADGMHTLFDEWMDE